MAEEKHNIYWVAVRAVTVTAILQAYNHRWWQNKKDKKKKFRVLWWEKQMCGFSVGLFKWAEV